MSFILLLNRSSKNLLGMEAVIPIYKGDFAILSKRSQKGLIAEAPATDYYCLVPLGYGAVEIWQVIFLQMSRYQLHPEG